MARAGEHRRHVVITHTLKGAARGVGAFGLADIAAEAEKISTDKTAALEIVHRLKNKSCAVQLFVDQLIKSPGNRAFSIWNL